MRAFMQERVGTSTAILITDGLSRPMMVNQLQQIRVHLQKKTSEWKKSIDVIGISVLPY